MNLNKLSYIHFIGIGGIGMSGLARYFNHHGLKVSGYDRTSSELTERLKSEGITVYHEDQPAYMDDLPDLVIYTPAVPDDHPEFMEARASGIPLMKRASALGKISESYQTIAVAGTHGKTTTSTMIASLLKNLDVDLTAFLGGISNDFDGNLVLGKSPWMITEADEYDRSFLKLHPQFAVINSLDPDHLDIYGAHEEMIKSYADFISGMPAKSRVLIKYGLEKDLLKIKNHLFDDKVLKTFGFEEEADYRINETNGSKGSTIINWSHNSRHYTSTLGMAGDHNAMNGLAAMAVCVEAGFEIEKVATALSEFKGIHRRFEKIIETDEIVIIDDYAHHPKEIEETVRGVKSMYPGRRVIGVFQAHLYSRTRDFMSEFSRVLSELDVFYSCELYPAREEPIPGISGKTLFDAVDVEEKYFLKKEELGSKIEWKKNDVILIMGAGNINSIITELKTELNSINNIAKSIMGLPFRSIAAYAIGITMVVSAAMFKYNSPITELRIDIIALPVGKNLINEKDITSVLMESFKTDFVGWKMKEVDTEIIEKELDSNEFVKEVRVYVDARNRLTIMIEQREPVLRVQDTNGMSFYLDREGFRLPISKHYTARVRVATGELPRFEGRHLMSAQPIYKSLFTVSMAMSADPFYDAYIEQIHVDKEGEMYASPKIGDQKIRLGKAQNIESKLDNLRTFVEEVVPYQGWEVCQMIDLRFKDQIVCTRNNKMISLNNSIK